MTLDGFRRVWSYRALNTMERFPLVWRLPIVQRHIAAKKALEAYVIYGGPRWASAPLPFYTGQPRAIDSMPKFRGRK